MKNYKSYLILIIIIAITNIFLGCTKNSKPYLDIRVCPDPSQKLTEEETLSLMKENLSSIAKYYPKQDLNGHVFFKDYITVKQFIEIANKYNVNTDQEESATTFNTIQILTNDMVGGISLDLNNFSADSFSENTKVINFSANTTAEEFLKMWKENEDIVRGIGVDCTTIFYIVKPSDPVKFTTPPMFL